MKRGLPVIFWGFALMIISIPPVHSQVKGNPRLKSIAPVPAVIEKPDGVLSPVLKNLYENTAAVAKKAKPSPSKSAMEPYLQIRGDQVIVDVTVKEDNAQTRAELEKTGFIISAAYGRVISGRIPIKSLPRLEAAKNIRFAKPAYRPMHQSVTPSGMYSGGDHRKKTSPVFSQGDTAQRSQIARNKYKVNGKGVKVGILSDSYNHLGGAAAGVKSGDLPGPGNPFKFNKPVTVLSDLDYGTDEGRAMAEIVHDVAPGSEIAYHTAFNGQADFAQGILDLAGIGCKVIADDVIYFEEPFFQDGIIAQAVDQVKQKGVTYFSSAGNFTTQSYESDYRPSKFAPLGAEYGTAHNFSGPGDPPIYFQPVYLPFGDNFIASFQWDQSFFSAGGPAAESDFDIYLLNEAGEIVSYGAAPNTSTGDPSELFSYVNETQSNTFFIVILKFSGPDPTRLKYIFYGGTAFYQTEPEIPGILAPPLVGHAKADGAIATAAAAYYDTPAYGSDIPFVEYFSSKGGVANYFSKDGTRIKPFIRKKPDLTAPDGGNTSFFEPFGNGDIGQDTDDYPNFFGTSAAAPHAAGVAALMIQAQKLKTITPSQIRGVMTSNTVDMDDIYTDGFDKNFDFNTGTGLLKADAAVGMVHFPNAYLKNLRLEAQCSDDPANTRKWKIINPNPFEVNAHWFLAGFSQSGKIVVPPGSTGFSTKTGYSRNKPVPNIVILDWNDNFGFTRIDAENSRRDNCSRQSAALGIETEEDIPETYAKPLIAEVYPNPSAGVFKLYLSLDNSQNAELELISIDGRRLYKRSVQSGGIIDIDASRYKPGVYMLNVKQGTFSKTLKLIHN